MADTLKELNARIDHLNHELAEAQKRHVDLEKAHRERPTEPPKPTPYTDTDDYKKRIEEINTIRARINEINKDLAGTIVAIDEQILTLQTRRRELNTAIARETERQRKTKRLEELKAKQREIGEALQNTERQIFRLEEWNRDRLAVIEEQVSRHFQLAHFRLFELQIYGGG